MKKAKPVAMTIIWVYAIAAVAAVVFTGTEFSPYSLDGLAWTMGFAFSWFSAGGNMIPNIAYQQFAEQWSVLKVGGTK